MLCYANCVCTTAGIFNRPCRLCKARLATVRQVTVPKFSAEYLFVTEDCPVRLSASYPYSAECSRSAVTPAHDLFVRRNAAHSL